MVGNTSAATLNPTFNSWPRLNFLPSCDCSTTTITCGTPVKKDLMCSRNWDSWRQRSCSGIWSRKGTTTAIPPCTGVSGALLTSLTGRGRQKARCALHVLRKQVGPQNFTLLHREQMNSASAAPQAPHALPSLPSPWRILLEGMSRAI